MGNTACGCSPEFNCDAKFFKLKCGLGFVSAGSWDHTKDQHSHFWRCTLDETKAVVFQAHVCSEKWHNTDIVHLRSLVPDKSCQYEKTYTGYSRSPLPTLSPSVIKNPDLGLWYQWVLEPVALSQVCLFNISEKNYVTTITNNEDGRIFEVSKLQINGCIFTLYEVGHQPTIVNHLTLCEKTKPKFVPVKWSDYDFNPSEYNPFKLYIYNNFQTKEECDFSWLGFLLHTFFNSAAFGVQWLIHSIVHESAWMGYKCWFRNCIPKLT